MKSVYLIAHSTHADSYTDAYNDVLGSISNFVILFWSNRNIITRLLLNLKVLFLPKHCVVIIENISFGMEALLVRRDLHVIHIPRGGGTFKIGWRSSGKLNFYVKLRLLRRNSIFVCSKIFQDYLSTEEATPLDRYKLCLEPICIIPDIPERTDVLVALSECAGMKDYEKITKNLVEENFLISYHPILKKKSDLYDLNKVKRIVTDCTTLCNYGFVKELEVNIIEENQSSARKLFDSQSTFFSGISKVGNLRSTPKYPIVNSSISDFQLYVLQS